jgi:hypothetical protein
MSRRHPWSIGGLVIALASLTAAPAGAQSPGITESATPMATTPPATATTPAPASRLDPESAAGRLVALRTTMEADRLLLAELRKDVPTDRTEAESYLARVQDLALASDPARLGVIVSRVREAAPRWLDWRAATYATTQEATTAYLQSGASAFDASWENLHDAVLLTVVNRLDTIIDLTSGLEEGQ